MIDMQVSQDSLMVKQELALLRETEGKSMEELEAMLKERAWDQLIQQETDFLFLKNDTSFNKMTLFQKKKRRRRKTTLRQLVRLKDLTAWNLSCLI